MIVYVYKHTEAGSKLRRFCVQSLVYRLQSGVHKTSSLRIFLGENEVIFQEFLEAVQNNTRPAIDTRIRDCGKDSRCANCFHGYKHCSNGNTGISPCWFHYHTDFDMYKLNEHGEWEENRIADECYFNAEILQAKLRG